MALSTLVRRSNSRKLLVSIQCHNLHYFKEGVILLSEYPWNVTNVTFTWLRSLYHPFKKILNLLFQRDGWCHWCWQTWLYSWQNYWCEVYCFLLLDELKTIVLMSSCLSFYLVLLTWWIIWKNWQSPRPSKRVLVT